MEMTTKELETKLGISYGKAAAFFAFARELGAVTETDRRKTPGKRGPGEKVYLIGEDFAEKLSTFTKQITSLATPDSSAVNDVLNAKTPRAVLGFSEADRLTKEGVEKRAKKLSTIFHPDRGYPDLAMQKIQENAQFLLENL